MLRHRFRALGWHEKALWLSVVLTWASVAVATADSATSREWVLAVLAALVTTQSALFFRTVQRRVDRMYGALLQAAMKRQLPEAGGVRRELAATRPQPALRLLGTSRSLSSGSA